MHENMQKQRENNHRSQQAGQHVALAERGRGGSERKQGRDDKKEANNCLWRGGRNRPPKRRPPAQGACGRRGRAGDAAQRGSRVTHGVDSRSHYSRAMWEDRCPHRRLAPHCLCKTFFKSDLFVNLTFLTLKRFRPVTTAVNYFVYVNYFDDSNNCSKLRS